MYKSDDFRKILNLMESVEQPQPSAGEPLPEVLDDIKDAAKSSISMMSQMNPIEISSFLQKNQQSLDEAGFKTALASVAIAGLSALSSLPAQAQNSMGERLASCAGDFFVLAGINQHVSKDPEGYAIAQHAYTKATALSAKVIGQKQAELIALTRAAKLTDALENEKTALPAWNSIKGNLQRCAVLINDVEMALDHGLRIK